MAVVEVNCGGFLIVSGTEDARGDRVRRPPPAWIRRFAVEDVEIRRVCEEVLAGIPPEECARFPELEIDEVRITAEGANVRGGDPWRLRLSPSQLKAQAGGDRAALRGLVAHELAHVFLRHAPGSGERNGAYEEIEADDQARLWVGADVDAFRLRFGPPYGMGEGALRP